MKHEFVVRKIASILVQLEKAGEAGRLSKGIKAVYNTATHRRGTLLIIEEELENNCKEVIDDIMEKVLKAGGDVEFVAPGTLLAYGQIALIE